MEEGHKTQEKAEEKQKHIKIGNERKSRKN